MLSENTTSIPPEDVDLDDRALTESLLTDNDEQRPQKFAEVITIPETNVEQFREEQETDGKGISLVDHDEMESRADTSDGTSDDTSDISSEESSDGSAGELLDKKSRKGTPLPWGSVLAVSIVLFANTLNRLIIFPFLPFMVQSFFPGITETQIGFYAGYLGAAFSLGGFFGNLIWGFLADRFGRRPIMLVGLASTIFTVTAFGFSQSFFQAVLFRFLWGLLNGNVGVGKTFLAEVCDDTNQARGFAVLGMLGGVGRLIGPAVGGLLVVNEASPLYKVLGHTWPFNHFPYSLPTICAGAFVLISFVMCYFWLPETLPNPPGCWKCLRCCCCCCSSSNSSTPNKQKSPLYEQLASSDKEEEEGAEMGNKASISDIDDLEMQKGNSGKRNGTVAKGVLDESLISEEENDGEVVTPVEEHGFHLEAHQIGLILTFIGPFQLLYQLTFPFFVNKFGYIKTFQLGLLVFAISSVGLPFLGFLNNLPTIYEYVILTACYLVMICGRLTSFTCVFVIISNACSKKNRGTVNGIGQSMAACARVLGPILGSISFAYSVTSNGSYPLNWMLDWHILAVLAFSAILLVRMLPKSLDEKIVEK